MPKWWEKSTVYQIYPKSFNDTTGNGSGDLRGIIEKLDYLELLGIEIIWLSPVYESPMDDNGYDISDYKRISKEFGSMQDVEELILEAKKRNIKIVMDLVVNHTSDEHKWFVESRKSKENPYRDYYIWRKGENGQPPSEINSYFSGSAWEYDDLTGEYYLHMFSKKQPDLNWDNENMRKEIYDMMNFWVDKGVSGFRMDVIELIGKNIDKLELGNTEKTHQYIQEMNKETLKGNDLFTVGETGGATIERAKLYTNPLRNELDTVFQFQHIGLDEVEGKSKWDLKKLDLVELKKVLTRWQTELGNEGCNSIYWNNHDQPRIVSRWGNDKEYRIESAKMFAILLHFMKGVPYVYQGEEIGMTNAYFEQLSDYKDLESLNLYHERIEKGYKHEEIMKSLMTKGRDNSRTPMQWDNSNNAGFTSGIPWIKVNSNYKEINVKDALADKNSIFYCYKNLIEFRKDNDIVSFGEYELLLAEDKNVFAYLRSYKGKKILVIANFTNQKINVFEKFDFTLKKIIISNYENKNYELNNLNLKAYETFACFVE